ncbi:MAG: hypothetical protein V4592_12815 [Bacteroidota bacterium]
MKKVFLLFVFFTAATLHTFAQEASAGESMKMADATVFMDSLKANAFLFKQYISLYQIIPAKPSADQKAVAPVVKDNTDELNTLAFTNILKANAESFKKHIAFYPFESLETKQAVATKMAELNALAFTNLLKVNAEDFKKHIAFYPFDPLPAKQVLAANTDTQQPPMVIASTDNSNIGLYVRMASRNVDTSKVPFPIVTDQALQASLSKHITENFNQLAAIDTVKEMRVQVPAKLNDLQQQLSLLTSDTLKAAYYQKMADYYLLKYDSVTVKKTRLAYQETAIEYTMKALHSYSRYNDVKGLRTSFDNLVRVYKDQRKFSQAKWFILQSNTISRQLNDAPNIVTSLITLAGIKMSIKDYSLAMRDLNEALELTTQNKYPRQESIVQVSLSTLYTHLKDPKKAAIALKRHDFIEDSIVKAEDAQRIAAIKSQDSTQQSKKKLYTSVGKKISKTSLSKKTVSL